MDPSIVLVMLVYIAAAQTGSKNPLDTAETLALNQKILDYHNWQRHFSAIGKVPGPTGTFGTASDMVNLIWDDGLSAVAQAYSEKCVYEHNPLKNEDVYENRATMKKFKLDKLTKGTGENIGFATTNTGTTVEIVMQGMQDMFEESNDYTWSSDSCSQEHCGHYTQMTWATTRYIGCGYSSCSPLTGTSTGDVADALFYVCNYWPLGNRYVTGSNGQNTLVPIYDETGAPCDNCPWDKAECNYDASIATGETYDPDWNNMPTGGLTNFSNGLCIGCGNEFYEICSTGLNNGLGDNCNSNIGNVGCSFEWTGVNSEGLVSGNQVCDKDGNDADNDIPGASKCTVSDNCRFQCGSCFCDGASATFSQCLTECDDGLGRNIESECDVTTWKESYLENVAKGCSGGGPTSATSSINVMHVMISVLMMSCILSI